jgi:hypothetical protein
MKRKTTETKPTAQKAKVESKMCEKTDTFLKHKENNRKSKVKNIIYQRNGTK